MSSAIKIAAAARGSGTVLAELAGTEPWRPRIIGRGRAARVALVQTRATILRGDAVELSVSVGAGAALELLEIGATLTHDARGGDPARVSVDIAVGDGGRLTWLGAPLVVARGADVERTVRIELSGRGAALLGETIVLGRAHGPCGALHARTRIVFDGQPTVDETLDTGDPETLRSPVVAGQARVIAALTLAGLRDDDPPPGAMQAYGPATLWRATGGATEIARRTASVAERWQRVLSDRGGEDRASAGEEHFEGARSMNARDAHHLDVDRG